MWSVLISNIWLLRLSRLIMLMKIMKIYSCWWKIISILCFIIITLYLCFSCSHTWLWICRILSLWNLDWISFKWWIWLLISEICLGIYWLSIQLQLCNLFNGNSFFYWLLICILFCLQSLLFSKIYYEISNWWRYFISNAFRFLFILRIHIFVNYYYL